MNNMKAYCVILVVSLACLMHSSSSDSTNPLSITGDGCNDIIFRRGKKYECTCSSSDTTAKPVFKYPNGTALEQKVEITIDFSNVPNLDCTDGTNSLTFDIKFSTLSITGDGCNDDIFDPYKKYACICSSSDTTAKPVFEYPNGTALLQKVEITRNFPKVPFLMCVVSAEKHRLNITFARPPGKTSITADKTKVELCNASTVHVNIACTTNFDSALPPGGKLKLTGPGVSLVPSKKKQTHTLKASMAGQYTYKCTSINSIYQSVIDTREAVVNVYGPPVIKVNGMRVLEGMTGKPSHDNYTIECTVADGLEKGKDVNLKCGDETRTSTGTSVELVINSTTKFHSGQCTCQGAHTNSCSNRTTTIEVGRTTGKGSHGNRIEVNILEISVGFLTALLMSALQAKRV